MPFVTRLLLCLCVLAGMATGMVHSTVHEGHDDCAHSHSHEHHDHDGDPSHPADDSDTPHHHECCHYPAADRPLMALALPCSFLSRLVEISTERSLAPDEPLFLLDKPPLI